MILQFLFRGASYRHVKLLRRFRPTTRNSRSMHSRMRLRTTGMSLCRYIKETRRPRMRVASQLKHQRTLAYRPRGMTGLCVRVGIQWAQLTRYLIAPRQRQRRRCGPNVKVVLCLIYATEPGTGGTKIGPRRDRAGCESTAERAATASEDFEPR